MKKLLTVLITGLTILIFSCKKDTQPSSQVISFLQNKWTLVSDVWVYPTNSSINSSYAGIATDYYLFNANDTLTIQQAGDPIIINSPRIITTKYSVLSNNSILIYEQTPGSNVMLTIQKITKDTLILTNDITASFTNNGGNTQTTYNGTRTVTLIK
jgi:hypothetical protein